MTFIKHCPHCTEKTLLFRIQRRWVERRLTYKRWYKCQCGQCHGVSFVHRSKGDIAI